MAVTLAKKNPENKNCIGIHYAGRCVAAFIIGIVIHGILDITPHQYPLRARIDILISIVFFVVSIGRLLSRENRRHGKKMSFYFLFMPRIAVGSNALVYARHERELMGCKSPMCESC